MTYDNNAEHICMAKANPLSHAVFMAVVQAFEVAEQYKLICFSTALSDRIVRMLVTVVLTIAPAVA